MAKILKQHGIEPGPERGKRTPWSTFLKSHWECLAATDLFTIEVWGLRGLVTFCLLIVMELSTRRVHLAGVTPNPNTAWMMQMGRNLTAPDGVLAGKRFIIMDRDSKFCDAFRTMLSECGTEPLRVPPRSPNLNAHCERFVRSIKSECLEKMIFFDERSLLRLRSDCPAADRINGPYEYSGGAKQSETYELSEERKDPESRYAPHSTTRESGESIVGNRRAYRCGEHAKIWRNRSWGCNQNSGVSF